MCPVAAMLMKTTCLEAETGLAVFTAFTVFQIFQSRGKHDFYRSYQANNIQRLGLATKMVYMSTLPNHFDTRHSFVCVAMVSRIKTSVEFVTVREPKLLRTQERERKWFRSGTCKKLISFLRNMERILISWLYEGLKLNCKQRCQTPGPLEGNPPTSLSSTSLSWMLKDKAFAKNEIQRNPPLEYKKWIMDQHRLKIMELHCQKIKYLLVVTRQCNSGILRYGLPD